MNDEIKITLDTETGEITVESLGTKGPVCMKKIKFLVDALMGPSQKVEHKSEFFQTEQTRGTVKLG